MGLALTKGRFCARLTTHLGDIAAAQALRHESFHGHGGLDCDGFDARCLHLMVEERGTGRLMACCRIMPVNAGRIDESYSAQYYELSELKIFEGVMLEVGRFCTLPGVADPDILRISWALLTRYVDENNVEMLFGCSSFAGTDATLYRDTFAMLNARHLAPKRWSPRVKAAEIVRFGNCPARAMDVKQALLRMPPLLRTYLAMGGWVSDHAVVDEDMGTLHVFTGLEVAAIPPSRKRLLRVVAA